MKKNSLLIPLYFLLSLAVMGQEKTDTVFSGGPAGFVPAFERFMIANLTPSQVQAKDAFILSWQAGAFSAVQQQIIWEIMTHLESRGGNPIPHFTELLKNLNALSESSLDPDKRTDRLHLLQKIIDQADRLTDLSVYLESLRWLYSEQVLHMKGAGRWKASSGDYALRYDNELFVEFPSTQLIYKAGNDSIVIYEVSGTYRPLSESFTGTEGTISWEKAGLKREEALARLGSFSIDLKSSEFHDDTAYLIFPKFFQGEVGGSIVHKATNTTAGQHVRYPDFSTFQKRFEVNELFKGFAYEGGLRIQGKDVSGFGEMYKPARLDYSRNDTLYLHLTSPSFLITDDGISSQNTTATFYLEKDSIYHANIALQYNAKEELLALYKTDDPVTDSPFENTFHQLDMQIDRLEWDLKGSKIKLTRPRGATYGVVSFESIDYFKETDFFRIMGMSNVHPLYIMRNFAEYYYSETFPVEELAKWMKQAEYQVVALCIELAKEGFLHYDRNSREVTLKPRLHYYINSYAKQKDYDVIRIVSETEAPTDNAVLDLHNKRIQINGVPRIFLSDSQNVAIFPYGQKITLSKNRDFIFDGVVRAGMMTLFGKNFQFNYDTFRLELGIIDSISIATYTGETDEYGRAVISYLTNNIEEGAGELLIDHPMNKSGLSRHKEYPIFRSNTSSYVYFDRLAGLEGVYPKDTIYYVLDPYSFENVDQFIREDLVLEGTFYAGGIFPPIRQNLVVQEDNSLGFNMEVPPEGLPVYGGQGRVYGQVFMNNKGLKSTGKLEHLSTTYTSQEYAIFPDSLKARVEDMYTAESATTLSPETKAINLDICWYPKQDRLLATSTETPFEMFGNDTRLDGQLIISQNITSGSGTVNTGDSRIESNTYTFSARSLQADTANYYLKSSTAEGNAFIAENTRTRIDFDQQKSTFSLNTDTSQIKFPEIQYSSTMKEFEYDMQSRILSMRQPDIPLDRLLQPEELLLLGSEDLSQPNFISQNKPGDTIRFASGEARYLTETSRIEASNVQYVRIADALIQPGEGILTIGKFGRFDQLENANIVVNSRHILRSATVNIASSKAYTGSGIYTYEQKEQSPLPIEFNNIEVNDSLHTMASGIIAEADEFTLSPAFKYKGEVELDATKDHLYFEGGAAIQNPCPFLDSRYLAFASEINPESITIPYTEDAKDVNGNRIFSGHFVTNDSTHVFTAFLSPKKTYSDNHMVSPSGYLYYDGTSETYKITSMEKLSDYSRSDNIVTLATTNCNISGEGALNFGVDYDHFTLKNYGQVLYTHDSASVAFDAILGLDFFFSQEALQIMANELRFLPTASPVDLSRDLYTKAVKYYLGNEGAADFQMDLNIGGVNSETPGGMQHTLLLNQVKLKWNPETRSYQSWGKIGIGSVNKTQINIQVNGYLEIQKRKTGDVFDLYIKADDASWYYFGYTRGNMMALAGNNAFTEVLRNLKQKDRKHPESSLAHPYTYMLGVQGRLLPVIRKFERMQENETPE